MKRRLIILMLLAVVVISCQREACYTPRMLAAEKIYRQYADNDDLTVSLIGGYKKDGHTYNAVMLQARTTEAWSRLLADFGPDISMLSLAGIDSSLLNFMDDDSARVSLISRCSIHCDSTTLPFNQLPDSLLDMLDNFSPQIVNGKMVAAGVVYRNGVRVDSSTSVLDNQLLPHSFMQDNAVVSAALADGQMGYVVHLESDCRTVWLFFYADEDECQTILEHLTPSNWPQVPSWCGPQVSSGF